MLIYKKKQCISGIRDEPCFFSYKLFIDSSNHLSMLIMEIKIFQFMNYLFEHTDYSIEEFLKIIVVTNWTFSILILYLVDGYNLM